MALTSRTVTVSMPDWMYDELKEEAEKHGMPFSTYLQEVIRDHNITPMNPVDDPVVCVDENGSVDESETGAA